MTQKPAKSLKKRVFIQTLSALSLAELKTFKVFCRQSPTISKETKRLFEFLIRVHPHYEKLAESKILSKFFSDSLQAKKLLTHALHNLFELLQNWLIQQELKEDSYLQEQLLSRAYKKRFLHQPFLKNTQKSLNSLEADCLAIPDIWYKAFDTNCQLFYHVQIDKNQSDIESLSDMESHLELFYHGTQIRLFCHKIYRNKRLNNWTEADEKALELTLNFIQKNANHIPYFSFYTQVIQNLQKPDVSTISAFIQYFKQHRTTLDRLDQSLILFFTINSLNVATRNKDQAALQIQYDLFQYAFEHNLALLDNEISEGFFNNFMIVSCLLDETKLAQKMLKKYTPHFKPAIRDEFVNLMQCTLLLHQKKYKQLNLSLHKFQFKQPMFRIRSRNLMLKNFYEHYQTDDTLKNTILSELKKFRRYIQKQKRISAVQKTRYYTMISVIRKLTNVRHLRLPYRAKYREELTLFLTENTNQIMSSDWLLEKVKEL